MRIVIVGEGMLELSRITGNSSWRVGYGGDTLNTAIHLARLNNNVRYLTAVGTDHFSCELLSAWKAEGIDTSLIFTDPQRQAGLYAVHTDIHGERSFSYWRNDSAARYVFTPTNHDKIKSAASDVDLLYFSLISLAILPPAGRAELLSFAKTVRERGGRVAFDSNYRPRLWQSQSEAQAAHDDALKHCDIGLPTLEDEIALFDFTDVESVAAYWQSQGVTELVVKLGAEGCCIQGGIIIPTPSILKPIDTSGAGDAFNAGYLNARLNNMSIEDAARAGHRLASWVIMHPGAIPQRTLDDPYQ